jgi:hypothetical protein
MKNRTSQNGKPRSTMAVVHQARGGAGSGTHVDKRDKRKKNEEYYDDEETEETDEEEE